MGLKDLYRSTHKKNAYVIPALDKFLIVNAQKDNDRAFNVNAPSMAGSCLRKRYYMRTGVETDGNVDARSQRIFDNGTYFHIRMQNYLMQQGILLMDEIPVLDPELNIQGHTDGLLEIDVGECAILELKSINENGFNNLKDAKPEHVLQGLTYLYCAEKRRQKLHELYPAGVIEYTASEDERREYFAQFYQHLKSGSKFSREEKIKFQVELHISMDDILFGLTKPLTKAIFLYENKNTQELKEYVVERSSLTEPQLQSELENCGVLNDFVEERKLPPRGNAKTSFECKWCSYRNECWIV